MPGQGVARCTTNFGIYESGMDFEIRQNEAVCWVALSGIMDRERLSQLIRRLSPLLVKRGRTIILDGEHLCHLDYRAVKPLVEWSRSLRPFGHQLFLFHWSDYLKAILCMEDCDRELSPDPVRISAWNVLSRIQPRQAPR